jgi:hypothetical protein
MPFILLSQQERLEFEYEGATIYYHRLGQEARARVSHASTERGMQNMQDLWLLTCQEAVDAWDHIYDADMHLVPVPPSGDGQRAAIAALVAYFPMDARRLLAEDALSDAPEAIKKRWHACYPDASLSPTDKRESSLPVAPVVPNGAAMASSSLVTPEGSVSAPIGPPTTQALESP